MSPSDSDVTCEELVGVDEAQAILDTCELAARIVRSGGTTAVLGEPTPSLLDVVPDLARTVKVLHAEVARRASGEACYAVCENRFATPRRSELLSWADALAHLRRIPLKKRESAGGMWIVRIVKRAARKEAA